LRENRPYYAAGEAFAGSARWLRPVIIRVFMDNYCLADNIFNFELTGKKAHACVPVI